MKPEKLALNLNKTVSTISVQYQRQYIEMAAAQHVYQEDDSVDDNLLNQTSDYVFYDNLWSLARDLEVSETEIRRIADIKDPKEKIFKVCIFYFVLAE